ncbi:MAG: hypothetical protein IT383_11030 [Deltaproteobacteria bacterium]|nr:hypothetical protein [Deltaproteobacteria bacterium]
MRGPRVALAFAALALPGFGLAGRAASHAFPDAQGLLTLAVATGHAAVALLAAWALGRLAALAPLLAHPAAGVLARARIVIPLVGLAGLAIPWLLPLVTLAAVAADVAFWGTVAAACRAHAGLALSGAAVALFTFSRVASTAAYLDDDLVRDAFALVRGVLAPLAGLLLALTVLRLRAGAADG